MVDADAQNATDARIWLDRLILVSLVAIAFALGCQELADGDTWWHIRSGDWILSQRRVPALDPFSFASADRPWIDLHWGFQIVLSGANRIGGIAAVILLTAVVCGATAAVGLTARKPNWPAWVAALAWTPALLLMAMRFVPRPEITSFLFLALNLAILLRAERDVRFAWLLVPVQILWVNTHGLFVLGPIVLGAFSLEAFFLPVRGKRGAAEPRTTSTRMRSRGAHLGLSFLAMSAVCVVNPYGVKGALFPLELLPKVTVSGNPYKEYIAEFKDLGTYLRNDAIEPTLRLFYGRVECALLLFVALSFVLPAITASTAQGRPPARLLATILGTLGTAALAWTAFATLSLPIHGTPTWLVDAGSWLPVCAVGMGLAAAGVLGPRWPQAGVLAACAGVSFGGGLRVLRQILAGPGIAFEPGPGVGGVAVWPWATGVAGVLTITLSLRSGASLFRLLLSAAFGYLALSALRNAGLFALVAAFVMTANFSEWAAASHRTMRSARRARVALAARLILAGCLVAGTIAITSGVPFPLIGGLYRLGFREAPLVFAHDAARFAGQPAMPDRAFVFDLTQSAVYLFHNGPERKAFIDPRLEVPSVATFEQYRQLERMLNQGDPRWKGLVDRIESPLILLDHLKHKNAEGTLLADPQWRCVYFDATASLFLPTTRADLITPYPTVSFTARHFGPQRREVLRGAPETLLAEARGYYGAGWALLRRDNLVWTHRIPLMLLAAAQTRACLAAEPRRGGAWLQLGDAAWNQASNMRIRPLTPAEAWEPARGLTAAQATFAYRRAHQIDPETPGLQPTLKRALLFRDMKDAAATLAPDPQGVFNGKMPPSTTAISFESRAPAWRTEDDMVVLVGRLLEEGRPLAVATLARELAPRRMRVPWVLADRIAVVQMHLGDPWSAERLWADAVSPPSEALRLARLGEARLARFDMDGSRIELESACKADPNLGEGWFALAVLHMQNGNASGTDSAVRAGLKCLLTNEQRETMLDMAQTIAPYVTHTR